MTLPSIQLFRYRTETRLFQRHRQTIEERQDEWLGINIYSCWEIAKLVEYGKLELKFPIEDWLEIALSHPKIQSINLTIPIIIKSTQLSDFYKAPADQIIVATSINSDLSTLLVI